MIDEFVALSKGALTYVPGLYSVLRRRNRAEPEAYYSGVWHKHLRWSGLSRPRVVVELGPGRPSGCSQAARGSGVERYFALDTGYTKEPDPDSADFLFSHSVLEHVADLRAVMVAASRWLKPGAVMSHQIDLQSHGITRTWDGHRAFSDGAWRVVLGRRPFLINRLPYSAIVQMITDSGFEITYEQRLVMPPTLPRAALRGRWTQCADDDLSTFGGIVRATKP